MYTWPSHYPQDCPPSNAKNLYGKIYRFINGKTPTEKDFRSYYNNERGSNCQARGLSVLLTLSDCDVMQKAIPALKKKKIIVADVSCNVGLIAPTPSQNCKGHHTWWLATYPEDVLPLFQIV